MPDDLQQISAFPPEAKQVAPKGIVFEDLLHPERQRWKARSHIGVARRQPHTHAFCRDHRSISRPCKIRIRTLTSTVRSTITRRPLAPTISIRPPADTAWLVADTSDGPVLDQWGSIVGVSTAVLGTKFTDATGIAPQNVNFAIRSNVVELFLQSRNIQFDAIDPTSDDKPLSTADLSDKAVPAVVQVLCHGAPTTVTETESSDKPTVSRTMPHPAFRSFSPADSYDVMGYDHATLKEVSEAQ